MKKGVLLAVLAFVGFAAAPTRVQAQIAFGPELLFGTEFDFGLGGRIVAGMGTEIPLEFQGGFNVFLPDRDVDYWELNGNVWYTIDTPAVGAPYIGGGLNIGRRSTSESFSSTELAVNLGGGYRFNFTNTAPFIEARFALGGHDQFVIGGGFLFGGF